MDWNLWTLYWNILTPAWWFGDPPLQEKQKIAIPCPWRIRMLMVYILTWLGYIDGKWHTINMAYCHGSVMACFPICFFLQTESRLVILQSPHRRKMMDIGGYPRCRGYKVKLWFLWVDAPPFKQCCLAAGSGSFWLRPHGGNSGDNLANHQPKPTSLNTRWCPPSYVNVSK